MSDLSFTKMRERKVTLLCMKSIMANDTQERIPETAPDQMSADYGEHFGSPEQLPSMQYCFLFS